MKADYVRAREVVERWDSDQPKEANQDLWPSAAGSVWRSVRVGARVAGSYAFYRSPVIVDGVDYNGDGSLTRSGPTPKREAAESRLTATWIANRLQSRAIRRGLIESASQTMNSTESSRQDPIPAGMSNSPRPILTVTDT